MSASSNPFSMASYRSENLAGSATVPGDKSISHRSLILGALAVGETVITGLLEGQDVLDTANAMRSFGADVVRDADEAWHVHGFGVGGFAEPERVVGCGNSGTGVRLLMGAMATSPITATFTGDASLNKRPMKRVTDPLALFGAQSYGRYGGRLPMTIVGAVNPIPINYIVPVPSAQVKSALLFAGLNAPGQTVIVEKVDTRDHTERMLKGFGADISSIKTGEGQVITLRGYPELKPRSIAVPCDPSSAAFPICAAILTEGSDIVVPNVCLNPSRTGLFETLREMEANLEYQDVREEGGEPVANLRAVFSPNLKGVEVPPERAASMIDEYPVLSVVAAFATGQTSMRGVKELRVKESDRIDAMATGLRANGIEVEEGEDWWIVHGRGHGNVPGGNRCATRLDHRIAMSFLVLGLAANKPVSINDASPIATSFPTFEALMTGIGANIRRLSE
ncbi:MAG: 3-phosphoshikimate 1-carboxyvinyltransferase [Roseovarius sp.]|nr:3-phosphoshikimate 1-carboxyvinyltransferase [Roseovarius sp.]